MSFYGACVVPHLVHVAMRNKRLLPYRERTISASEGRVLEIGVGSGLNLPFYAGRVKEVIGLESRSETDFDGLRTLARRAFACEIHRRIGGDYSARRRQHRHGRDDVDVVLSRLVRRRSRLTRGHAAPPDELAVQGRAGQGAGPSGESEHEELLAGEQATAGPGLEAYGLVDFCRSGG